MSDPTRRAILDRLARGDSRAKGLATGFDMSQPAISQHLKILRDAGLVHYDRRGREHWYALRPDNLREVYDWIEHYRAFWEDRLDALEQVLEDRHGT